MIDAVLYCDGDVWVLLIACILLPRAATASEASACRRGATARSKEELSDKVAPQNDGIGVWQHCAGGMTGIKIIIIMMITYPEQLLLCRRWRMVQCSIVAFVIVSEATMKDAAAHLT
ncbi:MAG: hypothetical protein HC841_03110 [Verrucomicrobiae bacterium]|nr:hypothetical protein [Verrucomicrobiae bacterium]